MEKIHYTGNNFTRILLLLMSLHWTEVDGFSQHTSVIGFTAWAQQTIDYVSDDLIVFDGVNINEGGFYQPSSGRFICPRDGVYYVSVNIRRNSGVSSVKVVKNETEEIIIIRDDSGSNDYNIQSNSALFQCNALETVELRGDTTGQLYGEMGIPTSTFTLFLISSAEVGGKKHEDFNGFSAFLNYSSLIYTASETLTFEGLTLPSPDYNGITGEYTCPISGMYFVNTNLQKYSDFPMNVGLALDVTFVLHSDDVYEINNDYNQHSNSRFLFCSEEQNISVRGFAAGYIYGDSSDVLSTVSVMLVHKAEEASDTLQHPTFIGFSAYNIEHQQYSTGDIITFDGILINEGGYFDGQSFRCPVSGIYFLSFNFKKTLNYNIYLDVKQGSVLLFRTEETYALNQLNTVSNSGLFQCVANQEVRVEAFGSGWVHGDPLKYFTTFSIMYMGQKE